MNKQQLYSIVLLLCASFITTTSNAASTGAISKITISLACSFCNHPLSGSDDRNPTCLAHDPKYYDAIHLAHHLCKQDALFTRKLECPTCAKPLSRNNYTINFIARRCTDKTLAQILLAIIHRLPKLSASYAARMMNLRDEVI